MKVRKNNNFEVLVCFYGFILPILSFLLWGTHGINLADEGFLWYGAQRTLVGEVPLRDFQAYEPARYYWVASWLKIMGSNGLYPFRASLALFQAIGISVGALLVYESTKSKLITFIAAPVFLFWMISPFKAFEDVCSIFLVGATYLYVSKGTVRSAFFAGVVLGFCTMFGRNLGLYGGVAMCGAICLSAIAQRSENLLRSFLYLALGTVVGLLPLIGLIIFSPGLFQAFIDSVIALRNLKGTNLPLPVPFPWTISFLDAPNIIIRNLAVSVFFVVAPVFALLGISLILFRIKRIVLSAPLFVSSVLVLAPFLHYAFSRADPEHLSCSIQPFLIGCFCLPLLGKQPLKIGLASILLLTTWVGIRRYNPYFRDAAELVPHQIGNHTYQITKENEHYLQTFSKAVALAGPQGRIFVAPHWPAAYPILGQKCPTWESFFLFQRPDDVQISEAKRLAEDPPKIAIIRNYPLDGRNELMFMNTHPLLWKFITDGYHPIPLENLPGFVTIYVKNDFVPNVP